MDKGGKPGGGSAKLKNTARKSFLGPFNRHFLDKLPHTVLLQEYGTDSSEHPTNTNGTRNIGGNSTVRKVLQANKENNTRDMAEKKVASPDSSAPVTKTTAIIEIKKLKPGLKIPKGDLSLIARNRFGLSHVGGTSPKHGGKKAASPSQSEGKNKEKGIESKDSGHSGGTTSESSASHKSKHDSEHKKKQRTHSGEKITRDLCKKEKHKLGHEDRSKSKNILTEQSTRDHVDNVKKDVKRRHSSGSKTSESESVRPSFVSSDRKIQDTKGKDCEKLSKDDGKDTGEKRKRYLSGNSQERSSSENSEKRKTHSSASSTSGKSHSKSSSSERRQSSCDTDKADGDTCKSHIKEKNRKTLEGTKDIQKPKKYSDNNHREGHILKKGRQEIEPDSKNTSNKSHIKNTIPKMSEGTKNMKKPETHLNEERKEDHTSKKLRKEGDNESVLKAVKSKNNGKQLDGYQEKTVKHKSATAVENLSKKRLTDEVLSGDSVKVTKSSSNCNADTKNTSNKSHIKDINRKKSEGTENIKKPETDLSRTTKEDHTSKKGGKEGENASKTVKLKNGAKHFDTHKSETAAENICKKRKKSSEINADSQTDSKNTSNKAHIKDINRKTSEGTKNIKEPETQLNKKRKEDHTSKKRGREGDNEKAPKAVKPKHEDKQFDGCPEEAITHKSITAALKVSNKRQLNGENISGDSVKMKKSSPDCNADTQADSKNTSNRSHIKDINLKISEGTKNIKNPETHLNKKITKDHTSKKGPKEGEIEHTYKKIDAMSKAETKNQMTEEQQCQMNSPNSTLIEQEDSSRSPNGSLSEELAVMCPTESGSSQKDDTAAGRKSGKKRHLSMSSGEMESVGETTRDKKPAEKESQKEGALDEISMGKDDLIECSPSKKVKLSIEQDVGDKIESSSESHCSTEGVVRSNSDICEDDSTNSQHNCQKDSKALPDKKDYEQVLSKEQVTMDPTTGDSDGGYSSSAETAVCERECLNESMTNKKKLSRQLSDTTKQPTLKINASNRPKQLSQTKNNNNTSKKLKKKTVKTGVFFDFRALGRVKKKKCTSSSKSPKKHVDLRAKLRKQYPTLCRPQKSPLKSVEGRKAEVPSLHDIFGDSLPNSPDDRLLIDEGEDAPVTPQVARQSPSKSISNRLEDSTEQTRAEKEETALKEKLTVDNSPSAESGHNEDILPQSERLNLFDQLLFEGFPEEYVKQKGKTKFELERISRGLDTSKEIPMCNAEAANTLTAPNINTVVESNHSDHLQPNQPSRVSSEQIGADLLISASIKQEPCDTEMSSAAEVDSDTQPAVTKGSEQASCEGSLSCLTSNQKIPSVQNTEHTETEGLSIGAEGSYRTPLDENDASNLSTETVLYSESEEELDVVNTTTEIVEKPSAASHGMLCPASESSPALDTPISTPTENSTDTSWIKQEKKEEAATGLAGPVFSCSASKVWHLPQAEDHIETHKTVSSSTAPSTAESLESRLENSAPVHADSSSQAVPNASTTTIVSSSSSRSVFPTTLPPSMSNVSTALRSTEKSTSASVLNGTSLSPQQNSPLEALQSLVGDSNETLHQTVGQTNMPEGESLCERYIRGSSNEIHGTNPQRHQVNGQSANFQVVMIPVFHEKITFQNTLVKTTGKLYPQYFYAPGNKCIVCCVCLQWMSAVEFMIHHDQLPPSLKINWDQSLAEYDIQFLGELSDTQFSFWNQFCQDVSKARESWKDNRDAQPNPAVTSTDRTAPPNRTLFPPQTTSNAFTLHYPPYPQYTGRGTAQSINPPPRNHPMVGGESFGRQNSQPAKPTQKESQVVASARRWSTEPMPPPPYGSWQTGTNSTSTAVQGLSNARDIPGHQNTSYQIGYNAAVQAASKSTSSQNPGLRRLLGHASSGSNPNEAMIPSTGQAFQSSGTEQPLSGVPNPQPVFRRCHLTTSPPRSQSESFASAAQAAERTTIVLPGTVVQQTSVVGTAANGCLPRGSQQGLTVAQGADRGAHPTVSNTEMNSSPEEDPQNVSTAFDNKDPVELLALSQKCHARVLKLLLTQRDKHTEEIKRLKVELSREVQGRRELQSSVSSLLGEMEQLKMRMARLPGGAGPHAFHANPGGPGTSNTLHNI